MSTFFGLPIIRPTEMPTVFGAHTGFHYFRQPSFRFGTRDREIGVQGLGFELEAYLWIRCPCMEMETTVVCYTYRNYI